MSRIASPLSVSSKTVSLVGILYLCCGLFFFSCNATKKTQSTPLKKRSAKYLLRKMESQRIKDVEWLSSKAKLSYRDASESIKMSANIRLRKDSILWLNVKKAGAEAARIQITPDSIYIINRLDNEYMIKDFGFIKERFNLDLSFSLLQDMVLGNPIMIPETAMEVEIEKAAYQLRDSDGHIKTNFWLNGITLLLEEMSFIQLNRKSSLSLSFGAYEEIFERQKFSYFRTIVATSPETGEMQIEIKLSKTEFNIPKIIKFEIPSRYTRID